jgi:hypothetical protein
LAISADLSLDARDILQLKRLADREGALGAEIAAMREALDRMAGFLEHLQIKGMHEVPYEVQRLLLFGLLHYRVEVTDAALEDWFWRSTFAEEHQSKPESYVSRLVREMRSGDGEPALEVRKPIEADLLARRVRRGRTAVATGFDLLLRRSGARSLLSGEPVPTGEGLHGLVFSRDELGGTVDSPQVLANLVLLAPDDADAWKGLRRASSLSDLYSECEARTGRAEEIWDTQGLILQLDARPDDLLAERSRALLARVVPDIATGCS